MYLEHFLNTRAKLTFLVESPDSPFAFMAAFFVLFQLFFTTRRGSTTLLAFFNLVLSALGKSFQFSTTPATVLKDLGFDRVTSHIVRYVTCSVCQSLYLCDASIPTNCTFVRFPVHSQAHHRQPCDAPLLLGNAKPRKEYPYSSLKHSLQVLFQRPGFEKKVNEWRHRTGIPTGVLYDVYDGKMWRQIPDGENPDLPFVDHHRSLLLTLNVDWFRPFRNSPYSCGAIYLVVNNLPRAERFKKENVILVGIMPGPKEAKKSDMNHYLRPLVDELEDIYFGVDMATHDHPYGTTVRAALLMVACDIPATRKVSGFTAHNSVRACYKCDRSFEVTPGTTQVDFSGFDVSTWRANTREQNFFGAGAWKRAVNKAEQDQVERQWGARWSELHRLVYFDVVRCSTIDPMHNLFLGTVQHCNAVDLILSSLLGTAKRMAEKWMNDGYLSGAQLKIMQTIANGVLVPPGFDMLYGKIESGFSSFKASEWRSWCLVFSPLLLSKVLPSDHFNNWMRFVDACRLLAKPSIRLDEMDLAHDNLVKFCQGCERLYSREFITPNMHLHGHLRDTVADFGPVYAFWLFGFERYNGHLTNVKNNKKGSFEITLMKRFIEQTHVGDFVRHLSPLLECREEKDFLSDMVDNPPSSSATSPTTSLDTFNVEEFIQASEQIVHAKGCEPLPANALPRVFDRVSMCRDHYNRLLEFYKVAYEGQHMFCDYLSPVASASIVMPSIEKFVTLRLHGQLYRSAEAESLSGSYIQVLFEGFSRDTVQAWPGQVLYYFRHELSINGEKVDHTFALVQWYTAHGPQPFESAGLEVWKDSFRPLHTDSIVPVQRIFSSVAIAKRTAIHSSTSLVIVIPLQKKSHA